MDRERRWPWARDEGSQGLMLGFSPNPGQIAAKIMTRRRASLLALAAVAALGATPAGADDKIENRVAVFSALDKVTATIQKLEVPIGETAEFGALKVTPRVCYSRPPTVQPKTTSFVEVEEVQLDGAETRIFSGWMFAQSPGLNAVEHPVFDVWLTDCAGPRSTVAQQQMTPPGETMIQEDGEADAFEMPAEPPRRRIRR